MNEYTSKCGEAAPRLVFVRARSTVRKKSSRTSDHRRDDETDGRERDEERRPAQVAAVRQREHERAAPEAEERAARERRELDHEQECERDGEGRLQPMPGLEPEVQRRQHEQRDDELDAEVVRIAGERVRAEHLLRPADGSEDVDPGLPRRDGLDEELVEVDAALGEDELDHAVHRVQADPAEERGERVPVEANAPAREQRDSGHEEAEVEDELHHPLGPLRERLGRVEVVEAREVDEREEDEEREGDHRGPGEAAVVPLEAIPREEHEEDGREDVGERQRARELPLQLVERDGEDREQEEAVEDRLGEHAVARARERRGRATLIAGEGSHSALSARASESRSTVAASAATLVRDLEARHTLEDDLPAPAPVADRLRAREADRRPRDRATLSAPDGIVEAAVHDVDGLRRRRAAARTPRQLETAAPRPRA